jgi:hypothetical protein
MSLCFLIHGIEQWPIQHWGDYTSIVQESILFAQHFASDRRKKLSLRINVRKGYTVTGGT